MFSKGPETKMVNANFSCTPPDLSARTNFTLEVADIKLHPGYWQADTHKDRFRTSALVFSVLTSHWVLF